MRIIMKTDPSQRGNQKFNHSQRSQRHYKKTNLGSWGLTEPEPPIKKHAEAGCRLPAPL